MKEEASARYGAVWRTLDASEREIIAWTGPTSLKMGWIYAGKAQRGLLANHGFEKLIKNQAGSERDEPNTKGSTK